MRMCFVSMMWINELHSVERQACTQQCIEQSEHQDADDNVDVRHLIARRSIVGRDVFSGKRVAYADTMQQIPHRCAYDTAPEKAAEDVARIVNAQVHARPAVDKRPHDQRHGQGTAPDEQAEEDGNAERV